MTTQLPLLVLAGWMSAASLMAELPARPAAFPQPSEIPGTWKESTQPLPPLQNIISRPAPTHPVYGLYEWAEGTLQNSEAIKSIGWTNFRLSGPINDAIMKFYAENDYEVMLTIAARTPFATAEAPNGPWRNRKDYPTDEAFIEAYGKDITKVLELYGPGGKFFKDNPGVPNRPLRHLEIFNEPNLWYIDTAREDKANHYPPKDPAARKAQEQSRQALYAKLLKASHALVKERWPDVQVVGFAACGVAKTDIPFIRGVQQLLPDAGKYFDILSTHPYIRPTPPEADQVKPSYSYSIAGSTAEIRGIMQQMGAAEKAQWWTELNWTITDQAGGAFGAHNTDPRAAGRDLAPELQAAYIVRAYAWALRLGVERLHFMSLKDTDGVNSGFFNKDGTWRPSSHAVKTMISLMPRPKLMGSDADLADGNCIYRFDADYAKEGLQETVMAWRVKDTARVSIPWPAKQARLTDLVGHSSLIESTDGRIAVTIGPLPVYLSPAP